MCKKKDKLTDEQKEARKIARHEKRSEFLSRMVDEFKKIMVIYSTVFVTGFLAWAYIIYAKGTTPVFPYAIPVALITGYFGTIVAYCFAAYKEKDSLNKNNMVKNKDGTFSKIVSTVVNAFSNSTTKPSNDESDEEEAKG